MKILIGNAWPYANGSLHIGHIAALLPGDIIARYHRARGDEVYLVSGSDCYGTPVTIRARREGKSPAEISDACHEEFVRCFEALGFSYDRYGKTSQAEHISFVREFHQRLYQSPYLYEKEAPRAWCDGCNAFLADRYMEGRCPRCGADARGDQCEDCGAVLEPEQLGEPVCALCGGTPRFVPSKHLYLAVSRLEGELARLLEGSDWRKNAAAFTRRYLDEGLRDRAVTRDLDWGIEVPKPGYEDKRIYIWAENVLGYLSMSRAVAAARGTDFEELWSPAGDVRHYYVHGKDNIPFHTVILPALLLAHGGGWRLPDRIISSEYLTLEGKKISTSRSWAVWAKDIAARYHPDSIRYFLTANGPEKRDADFSWREFYRSHNHELLDIYGNFINRTLAFIARFLDGKVPEGTVDEGILARCTGLLPIVGALIEQGKLKEALEAVFEGVREANRYFDAQKPWETRQTDPAACGDTLLTCVQLASCLCTLLGPFLPFSSARVGDWLGIGSGWEHHPVPARRQLTDIAPLFQRLDPLEADREAARLGN